MGSPQQKYLIANFEDGIELARLSQDDIKREPSTDDNM